MARKSYPRTERKDRVWVTAAIGADSGVAYRPLSLLRHRVLGGALSSQTTPDSAMSPYSFLADRMVEGNDKTQWRRTIRAARDFTIAGLHIVAATSRDGVGFVGFGIQGGMPDSANGVVTLPGLGDIEATKAFPLVVPCYPHGGGTQTLSMSIAVGSSKSMRKVSTGQWLYISSLGVGINDGYVRFLALL